jgi:hypothetical protein
LEDIPWLQHVSIVGKKLARLGLHWLQMPMEHFAQLRQPKNMYLFPIHQFVYIVGGKHDLPAVFWQLIPVEQLVPYRQLKNINWAD